jgi:hypothetical protein
MRGRILELIVVSNTNMERIRIIQTLEILEHTSPFTTPKFQGDEDNECTKLRIWINSAETGAPDGGSISRQEFVKRCPFPKELDTEALKGWLK